MSELEHLMWSIICDLVYVCFLECQTELNMGNSLASNCGKKGHLQDAQERAFPVL